MAIRKTRFAFALCLAAPLALFVSAALGRPFNGGATIAQAPDLPLGQVIATGWNQTHQTDIGFYGEFWHVTMQAGDKLVLDWAVTATTCADGSARGFSLYKPDVTDFTISSAQHVVERDNDFRARDEFIWIAPSGGRWTLFTFGCQDFAYTLSGQVQQFTSTSAVVPSLVKRKRAFSITGAVQASSGTPPANGAVNIRLNGPGYNEPRQIVAALSAAGKFKLKLHLAKAGTYSMRITFPGDANHRPSSAKAKLHVG